jgi:glycosyltransferase involved in cell wall biosynthesis
MRVQLNWIGAYFSRYSGYGRISLNMIRTLKQRGALVMPVSVQSASWDGELLRDAGIRFDRLSIALMPGDQLPRVPGKLWGYTMYETTQPPEDHVECINATCERLLVTCDWQADVYRKAGVLPRIPMHVLQPGVDPLEFPYIERPADTDRPYTFLTFADRVHKADGVARKAFFDAFPNQDDVRLIIKTTVDHHENMDLTTADPRIIHWRESVERMAGVYAQADCLVFSSFGEGWGMPAREAAATGLPVIATNWGGLAVDIEKYAIPVKGYKLVENRMYGGEWAFPDVAEVAQHMRWCYENREQAKVEARVRSEWVRQQTWDKSADVLLALIEEAYQMPMRKVVESAAD